MYLCFIIRNSYRNIREVPIIVHDPVPLLIQFTHSRTHTVVPFHIHLNILVMYSCRENYLNIMWNCI